MDVQTLQRMRGRYRVLQEIQIIWLVEDVQKNCILDFSSGL